MADSIPDADDVMEAEYPNQVADPLDDFDIEHAIENGNNEPENDDRFREPTPIPEDAMGINPQQENENQNGNANLEDGDECGRADVVDMIVVNQPAVDLDVTLQSYTGNVLIDRLTFIMNRCPPLRRDCLIALINVIKKDTQNTNRYKALFQMLETMDKGLTDTDAPAFDQVWFDQTSLLASARLDILLSEYKKQKDEGVKESTRRAIEDLFEFYRSTGQLGDALKLYTKGVKETCTQFKHIMMMWLNWLETTILAEEWQRVGLLVSSAERTLIEFDSGDQKSSSGQNSRPPPQVAALAKANRHIHTISKNKVDACNGLNRLEGKKYKPAVEAFLKVDIDLVGPGWLVTGSDLAVYTTLCALATFDRKDIKKIILPNVRFRKCVESEPRLMELLQCFVKSQFGRCIDIMSELRDRFLLDRFICVHVDTLYGLIRERALVLYLRPFALAQMSVMATEFRCTFDQKMVGLDSICLQLENELVSLIERDVLNARIDQLGGLIQAVTENERDSTYEKIVDVCNNSIDRCDLALLRNAIVQGRMAVVVEGRQKRKPTNSDDATDPSIPTRGKMAQLQQGVMRALRPRQNQIAPQPPQVPSFQQHSEADSSEHSDEPREPEVGGSEKA